MESWLSDLVQNNPCQKTGEIQSKCAIAGFRYHCFKVRHYEIDQRWLVVFSQAALQRAQRTVQRAVTKEREQISKAAFHLQAQRFESKSQAHQALEKLERKWQYHRLTKTTLSEYKHYRQKGAVSLLSVVPLKIVKNNCKPGETHRKTPFAHEIPTL